MRWDDQLTIHSIWEPKTELPKSKLPKSEPPKLEPPKSEPPKSEPPKSEPKSEHKNKKTEIGTEIKTQK